MLKIVRQWLLASRAQFSITLILPGFTGIAYSWSQGFFNLQAAALTIAGLFFANLGTNLTNDFFDFKSGVDAIDAGRVYKKGSEILLADGLPSGLVLWSAILSFVLTAVCGVLLAVLFRPGVIYAGVFGLALGFFYTAPPFKFGYRGLGEIVSGFGSGPLAVCGSYYVQTGHVNASIVALSIPVGLLVASILYIGNVCDADADARVGKRTLSVRFGKHLVKYLGPVFLGTVYLSILVSVLLHLVSIWVLVAFLTLPMSINLVKLSGKYYNDISNYAPAIMKTVQVFALTTVLIITGVVVGRWF